MKRLLVCLLAVLLSGLTVLIATPAAGARTLDVRKALLATEGVRRITHATSPWGADVTRYTCIRTACGRDYAPHPFNTRDGDVWIWPDTIYLQDAGTDLTATQRLNARINEIMADPALGPIVLQTSNSVATADTWEYLGSDVQVRLFTGRYNIIAICSGDTLAKALTCASAMATAQVRKLNGRL